MLDLFFFAQMIQEKAMGNNTFYKDGQRIKSSDYPTNIASINYWT